MSEPTGSRRTFARAAALILGAAILALVVGNGPALWERVAYREPARKLGIEMREKRWSWLPGPGLRIAEQPCPSCQEGRHDRCCGLTGKIRIAWENSPPSRNALIGSGARVTLLRSTDPLRGYMLASTFQVDGVTITPATFRCPCCPAE